VAAGAVTVYGLRATWVAGRFASTLAACPAVGELVRCTNGAWMVRPPLRCPRGHSLRPGAGRDA